MFYLPLFLALLAFNAPTAGECFTRRSGSITLASDMHACNNTEIQPGGAQQCCNGVGDGICGTDRLCRNRRGEYYVGGCTDSTFRDPVCRSECTWQRTTWIQWVPGERRWHCCTEDGNGCNSGLENQTFNAVAPGSWMSVLEANASSAGEQSTVQGGRGLSSGAAIGIGVAVGIGGMAVLAGGFWLFRLRRRRREGRSGENVGLMAKESPIMMRDVATVGANRNELSTVEDPKELHGRQYFRELPA